jgi:hypothetical protein
MAINKSFHILSICQTLYLDQLLVPACLACFATNCGMGAWPFSFFFGRGGGRGVGSEGSGHTSGRGPNCGGGQSGGKRPMNEDLDAPLSTNWPPLSDSGIGSSFRGPSSG